MWKCAGMPLIMIMMDLLIVPILPALLTLSAALWEEIV